MVNGSVSSGRHVSDGTSDLPVLPDGSLRCVLRTLRHVPHLSTPKTVGDNLIWSYATMNRLLPRLEDLSLLSTAIEETNLMLPETLQAPDIRHLALHGIGLSSSSPLLPSAIALSSLPDTYWSILFFFLPGTWWRSSKDFPILKNCRSGSPSQYLF